MKLSLSALSSLPKKGSLLSLGALTAAIMLGGCGADGQSSDSTPTDPIDPNPSSGYQLVSSALDRDVSPNATQGELDAFRTGNHQLTVALHREATKEGENAMLSTYSIRSAFSLLYPGARGETASEIATVMGFDPDQDRALSAINATDLELLSRNIEGDDVAELEPVELHSANAFWSQEGAEWRDEYLDAIATNLGAPVYVTDFSADPAGSREVINSWVEDKTRDRIQELLPDGSITSMTRAVLTNAVYFKAPWASKFQVDSTQDADFTLLSGDTVNAQMMNQTATVGLTIAEDYVAAELPFRGGELAMVFILPESGQFEAFEASLSAETLADISAGLQPTHAHIAVPKFEFETVAPLNDPLQALGLGLIFNGGDLSGMSEGGGLRVSGVFHKTFVAVEEGGAEAAAATAIVVGRTSADPEPAVEFRLDRPFLFGIRDIKTGLYLFFGRVVNPS